MLPSRKRAFQLTRNENLIPDVSVPTIDDFCKELSPTSSRAVTVTVGEISRLRKQMVVNMFAIGESLLRLRDAIGSENFSQFMTAVLPPLGISRSTGYRWLGFADKLTQVFPNPLVRQHLMALTDGRGIVTNAKENGDHGPAKVVLTRAAETALKTLPPLPENNLGRADSEEWVRQFLHATAKARALDRLPGRNLDKDQQMIVRRFSRFAFHYGPLAAEDLCGQLDKMLNRIVETRGPKCARASSHSQS